MSDPRYSLGIRWDEDSTELSDTEPGTWWVDIWESDPGNPSLGAGSSEPVATKGEAIARIAEYQALYPDNRLDLPELAWFMAAPERPGRPLPEGEGVDRYKVNDLMTIVFAELGIQPDDDTLNEATHQVADLIDRITKENR